MSARETKKSHGKKVSKQTRAPKNRGAKKRSRTEIEKHTRQPKDELEELEIQKGIADDPDTFEWSEADFDNAAPAEEIVSSIVKAYRRGRPKKDNPKQQVTLRLDADIIRHFKAGGAGWQTQINNTLKKAIEKT